MLAKLAILKVITFIRVRRGKIKVYTNIIIAKANLERTIRLHLN
jgi:hypothetical protein